MTTSGNVSLLLAQVGQGERIAQELQANPEVQRQMAQQATPELLRRQGEQVSPPQEGQGSDKVRPKSKDEAGARHQGRRRRRQRERLPDAEPAPEPHAAWAGHIVNVKV